MNIIPSRWIAALAITGLLAGCATPIADPIATSDPLVIQTQGSFAAGGTVKTTPGTYDNYKPTATGQSFHGDHLYAFYQVPQKPRALPIVMLHGAFQSARSWETTPDGREGFQTLMLRRGFPVYLVDQPRRGRAGNSTVAGTTEPIPNDQLFFDQFRFGKWPSYFDNVQFDRKPETLDQFLRSVTPNTGPYEAGVISDAMAALFARTGPAILFTHSQGGGPGWLTAIRSPNVKAIVAFEPGSNWRVRLAMARLWVAAVNKHGGDAKLVHLPEVGIRGNTHFLMSDLNNTQIAHLVSIFLAEKKLD